MSGSRWCNKFVYHERLDADGDFAAPAEGSDAKIAPAITHVGGPAFISPPHPVEFDKMEKKGGQGKAKERNSRSGRETNEKFLLEMRRGGEKKAVSESTR